MADLLLASCDELPRLDEDSTPLLDALDARGITCRVAAWDDEAVDWSAADAVLARSTWDYADRRDAFVAWAVHVEATGVPFWPGADVVAWNTEKSYLRALGAAGVPVVPTVWSLPGADPAAAAAAVRAQGWDDVVVKPVIGYGADGLRRFSGVVHSQTEAAALLDHVAELDRRSGGAMLQPYLPAVADEGELSVFFCEGRITHAVRKRAAEGDFRVQPEHGGSFALATPGADELRAASWAVAAVAARTGSAPLLARADLVDAGAGPALIELELIEPRLFLRIAPEATATIADAIAARLAALG